MAPHATPDPERAKQVPAWKVRDLTSLRPLRPVRTLGKWDFFPVLPPAEETLLYPWLSESSDGWRLHVQNKNSCLDFVFVILIILGFHIL